MKSFIQNSSVPCIDTHPLAVPVNGFWQVILLLLVSQLVGCTAVSTPALRHIKSETNSHAQLAQFQLSTYLISNGTRLRLSVDKQLGGKVIIQFMDSEGAEYYQQTLSPRDTMVRLTLDLAELKDGDYILKVSNGLEMELREIKIATSKPTVPTRQVTGL
jgi:hypothetical protein